MDYLNTPWECQTSGEANEFRIMLGGRWLINFRQNGELMAAKQEAIGRHIVKCVNSHQDMLNALNRIALILKDAPGADSGNSKVHYALHLARNAANNATGGWNQSQASVVKTPIPDDGTVAPDAEYFPGATRSEIGEVMMQDVVGDYATSDQVPEWTWIEHEASFSHIKNGTDSIWEFVLNLSRTFTEIPARLVPVITEARNKNLAYLIFHQGT